MTRYLVVGGGSMGKRRVRCLTAIGIEPTDIRLVEIREDRRQEVRDAHGVEGFESVDRGLDWEPDAVIVSVPGAYHVSVCLAAARAKKHIFCEVPLALDLDGLDELAALVKSHGLVLAPGCQAVFQPIIQQTRDWVRDPAFGHVLVYYEQFGQYLPDWHPQEDYRRFYASNLNMGGGNMDVLAQEMTIAQWITDDHLKEVFCRGANLTTLELECPDLWQILGNSQSGTAFTLQFDVIQRAPYCSRRIISENGTIEMRDGGMRRYLAESGTWESYEMPDGYRYEGSYVDEIRHFDSCVKGSDAWPISLDHAMNTVRFLVALKRSAVEQQSVSMLEASL
jgi:predicted dehydrogenase